MDWLESISTNKSVFMIHTLNTELDVRNIDAEADSLLNHLLAWMLSILMLGLILTLIYCAIRFRQSNAKNEPRPRSMSVLPSTDSDYSDTDDEEGQEMTELKKNDLGDSKQEINFDRADLQHSPQITVSL